MAADDLFPSRSWKSANVGLVVVQALLAFIASLAVALRIYARISLHKKLALDDLSIILGLLFAIARAVVASLSSQSGWASRKGPDHAFQVPYYTHYFERRLFYALSAFFIRTGVLLYYLRLFPRTLSRLRFYSWILLMFSLAQCLQLCVVLAVYCDDITDLYRGDLEKYHNPRCADAPPFTYSGAIGDAAINAAIYVLPLPYVWGLKKLKLEQRLALVFIFGIGIIACFFALLQIPFIIMNYRYNDSTGKRWFGSQVSTFIAVELCLGLTAASLPDARGLIARIRPGFMAKFRHVDESCSGPDTHSRNRRRRRGGDAAYSLNAIPISGGARAWECSVEQKTKKPDWICSTIPWPTSEEPGAAGNSERSTVSERIEERGSV
ncbi:uncharacterized protein PV09_01924 [Verruconis gallopava]|uniref:Rhodopsin domain-containing protein n=1 Tax=Verruconis gallopava TaxID=253628 RepID=A0A0D2AKF3_9PEZI|nr:uncharacterized protein PV09_01924 [Verruconis gallopava]KIW07030.1 hypothetical protein PV09_01924 [Verruconis gallopava]